MIYYYRWAAAPFYTFYIHNTENIGLNEVDESKMLTKREKHNLHTPESDLITGVRTGVLTGTRDP
jgi:hypothetical protein